MKYHDFLNNLKSCPFCDFERLKIIENSKAFLTYSVAPYHQDHLLIVSKRRVEHILDLTDEEIQDINLIQKVGLKILTKLGYTNMCVLVKEGDIKEKSIAHTHYHLIPDIILGDSTHTGSDRIILTDLEISELVSKIKTLL
jgi:diadenosine tetraphosphate (Ap4A) HIT family hydrolase